jgi:hypothetical protein
MPKHKCCQALNPRRQRGFIHCLRQANVSGGPRAPWAECLARPSTAHEDECPIWNRRRRRTGVAQAKGAAAIADAGSEGELPGAAAQKRTVQHHSGAPGLDRTADTRFRKHAASVTGRCRSDAIVLHSPRTAVSPVLPSAFRWSAVMSRLVGILSAIRSELADAGGQLPNAREDPTRPLAPRTERNRCHTCVAVLFSRQPAHGIQPETLRIRHIRKGRPAPPGTALG